MTLLSRFTRLFKADMHGVIDQLEEPYALLKQSIREMEVALAEKERLMVQLRKTCKELDEKLEQYVMAQEKNQAELDICFEANNEVLARSLIKRQLEQQQVEQFFLSKRKKLLDEITALQECIEQWRPQLESMRQKAEVYADEHQDHAPEVLSTMHAIHVSQEAIEIALLREKQKRSGS